MGNLVNLNKFRKRAERENSAKEAEVNRVRFGLTKAERSLAQSRTDREQTLLNQHLLDGEKAT